MRPTRIGNLRGRSLLAAVAIVAAGLVGAAGATTGTYVATLDGASQSPPNDSPATGTSQVTVDDVAHTMHITVTFHGLLGTTTAAHIHAPTSVPGEGSAGVATTLPSFPGFPIGVVSGSYDHTFDTTDPGTFNPAFIANHGGDVAGAEAALFASFEQGTAYFNLHTTDFPLGEIRGFYVATVPIQPTTWGAIKAAFE
jgi:hypothetical protein